MTNHPNRNKKLTPAQLKRFRLHRELGATVSEAKRLARMSYDQLSNELSQRLRAQSEARK